MSWRWSMLVIVAVIIASTVVSALITGAYHSWAAVPQALSLLALLSGWLYAYAPRFRILIVQVWARFTNRLTRVKVSARFAISDEVTAQEIGDVIKQRYSGRKVKIVPAAGRMTVHVAEPGFYFEYTFFETHPTETHFDDVDDRTAGYVLFTVPDAKNSIDSARSLVSDDILPLFDSIAQALPLKLEALEMTIYFTRTPNPYLSAYAQHIESGKLTALDVTVTGNKPNTMASIKLDRITLSATNAFDLSYMIDQHLGFEWTAK